MRTVYWLGLLAALMGFTLASRTGASVTAAAPKTTATARADDKAADKKSDADEDEAEIKANLDKLSAKDRKLAQQQKYCAVQNDERLGSMGVPVKVAVKGQAVFLCCKGCRDDVRANPDRMLDRVKELKARARAEGHKHD